MVPVTELAGKAKPHCHLKTARLIVVSAAPVSWEVAVLTHDVMALGVAGRGPEHVKRADVQVSISGRRFHDDALVQADKDCALGV